MQQHQTANVRQSGIWDEDDEPTVSHRNSAAGVTYKSALNQNMATPSSAKKSTQQSTKQKNQNHQTKTKVVAPAPVDNVRICSIQVMSSDL